MRSAGRRASDASIGGRGSGSARYLISQTVQGLLIAAMSGGLFWLVWIYGNGLRDPRYLDGWVLAGGMSLQLYFHIARKTASLSPKSAMRWRKIHIFIGYLLIAAFILHSDFSLPDTGFEWALWAGFVLVALSGIFGTYLAWSLQTKRRIDEGIGYDRIPTRRAELARDVHAVVAETDPAAAAIALPAPPYDAWITDLYTDHLRDFFQGQRNFTAHLIGSQRPLKQLTDEIDNLSRYVDQQRPGEACRHQEPGGRERPARFRAGLSRVDQGLAVRARARNLCADRADGAARPRRLCLFIGALVMRRRLRIGSVGQPNAGGQAAPGSRRDRLAVLLALVTVVCLGSAFFLAKDTKFLMPGPLASAHGAIEQCSACHTKSGSGKLSWVHGLVAGDRLADSKACLTCHKMPDTAFNAHSASAEVLKQSTKRLTKIAATIPAPQSAHAQSIAFPTDDVVARGLYCATCHQEHQGVNFNLNKISNEQCRSCHVVKFDSFDGQHPKFDNYPFKQRTQIIYDHAGHFGKHFPEIAKKDPARRIPDTCSTCHNSSKDKRVMAVAPFEQTCTGCHLDQIIGKERVSGPKGIAFLALPGLDLQTLKKKKASIGEWPDASEAGLTPFMKVMISRNARGRALIKAVDSLDLQDLGRANNDQIKAVTNLVWEIKRLFYALIKGQASDVLGDLNIGGGAKLSATLVADLTASIPQDVIISAQQQWLPNLGTEMANREDAREQEKGGWTATITESRVAVDSDEASITKPGRSAQANRQTDTKGAPDAVAAKDVAAQPEAAAAKTDIANGKPGKDLAANEPPQKKGADQTDDLLFPTEEELRATKTGSKGSPKAAQSDATAGKTDAANAKPASADAAVNASANTPEPRARVAAPVISIKSDVDPESWAAYGGWYRQDYAIFYRPIGHKDKFVYSWLFLTGPQAPKGHKSPAAAVFDVLTNKDAQGSCTKCHSIDDIQRKGRVVNFSSPSAERKQGRFTNFIHEPHFGVVGDRGCLTCHDLEKDRPYLKSYEQGNPQSFVSNFGPVKKDLCQTCHTSSMARQDCLTCHKYHVNGVITPIINTKIPAQ